MDRHQRHLREQSARRMREARQNQAFIWSNQLFDQAIEILNNGGDENEAIRLMEKSNQIQEAAMGMA